LEKQLTNKWNFKLFVSLLVQGWLAFASWLWLTAKVALMFCEFVSRNKLITKDNKM
jgi:hypothetical protein